MKGQMHAHYFWGMKSIDKITALHVEISAELLLLHMHDRYVALTSSAKVNSSLSFQELLIPYDARRLSTWIFLDLHWIKDCHRVPNIAQTQAYSTLLT